MHSYASALDCIRRKAERKGDWRGAISAVRELTRIAELDLRVAGLLRASSNSGPSTLVQVNTNGLPANDADWTTTVRHARMIVEMADEEARDAAQALPSTNGQPKEVKP